MNENEVQVWNYEGAEVRTVQIDGEPWFVLADICRELEISNSRMVSERLESDELTRVDIIAEDKKLIEIYVAIIKELAVKYGVCA